MSDDANEFDDDDLDAFLQASGLDFAEEQFPTKSAASVDLIEEVALDLYPASSHSEVRARVGALWTNLQSKSETENALFSLYSDLLGADGFCMTVPFNEEIEETGRLADGYLAKVGKSPLDAAAIRKCAAELEDSESPEEYADRAWAALVPMLRERQVELLMLLPVEGIWSDLALIFAPIAATEKWHGRAIGAFGLRKMEVWDQ